MREKRFAKDHNGFFKELSDDMASFNHTRTPDECKRTINKLRDNYKAVVDNKNSTGKPPMNCEHEKVSDFVVHVNLDQKRILKRSFVKCCKTTSNFEKNDKICN